MLGAATVVAFVPTTDFDRARAFYCDLLGLQLVDASPYALVLRAGPTLVRVAKVDHLIPQPFTILGWVVADIAVVVGQLAQAGVGIERFTGMDHDELGVWTTPGGDRVAWFTDPDANTLSVTQYC
jgi:catechol 2,3-dioxygenase-like lactoylglutathione lyase family enzyme